MTRHLGGGPLPSAIAAGLLADRSVTRRLNDAWPPRARLDDARTRPAGDVMAAPTHALSQENAPMAADADASLATLDPAAGHLTVINTYAVAPERAEELIDLLVRATAETVGRAPGFVSANFHLSLDRTSVVNYAQWQSREALMAAAADPAVMGRIREAGQVADGFNPVHYELRRSVAAQA